MKPTEQHTGTKMFANAVMEGRIKATRRRPSTPQKKPAENRKRGK